MKACPEITERELDVLDLIWQFNKISAQDIAAYFLKEENGGYNKNTTYTFINRLVKKKVIKREDPGFICTPLFKKEEVQIHETQNFLNRIYQGSFSQLFSQFAKSEKLTEKDLKEIKEILNQYESKKIKRRS